MKQEHWVRCDTIFQAMKVYELGYTVRYERHEGEYCLLSKTINELQPAYMAFDSKNGVNAEYEFLEE